MYIDGSLGKIYGELIMPGDRGSAPLIVLSHGFGSSMNGVSRDAALHFAEEGFAVFTYDFCGGGMEIRSDGAMTDMSVLTEAQDLNAVLDTFVGDPRFSRIFLWGASQGGFVSALVAAQRPGDVAALALRYPAFVLQDDARARARPDGTFPETDTVMGRPIGRRYSEDAVSFDVYERIGAYTGDVLILHGDRDRVVPLLYARRAGKVYASARLETLEGQDHGFTGEALRRAKELETAFFRAHLG